MCGRGLNSLMDGRLINQVSDGRATVKTTIGLFVSV